MQVNRSSFDWRKFRSAMLFAVVGTITISLMEWIMHGNDNHLFGYACAEFIGLGGLAFLLPRTKVGVTKKDGLRGYWIVLVGLLSFAFVMAAFTLWRVLEHQNYRMQLQGWLVLVFIPLPWVFAAAGYFALKRSVSESNLSMKGQEHILRMAVKCYTGSLLFVCAIICGFARILSLYLR
jgi:magnesium-transporting ATPase (P-type)